jgi:hypothetical protein
MDLTCTGGGARPAANGLVTAVEPVDDSFLSTIRTLGTINL